MLLVLLVFLIYYIWGGSNPISAHGKNVYFPIFPHGENGKKWGKKVYGKRGKSIHFPLFQYTFFPIFSNKEKWGKWEKTHFSHGQKWGWTPPPPRLYLHHYLSCSHPHVMLFSLRLRYITKSSCPLNYIGSIII